MAGSYRHIVTKDNKFKGVKNIDNLGDAYEALEECYEFIQILTGGDKDKLVEIHQEYLRRKGGNVEYAKMYDYWTRKKKS